jgi:hypothetical protein
MNRTIGLYGSGLTHESTALIITIQMYMSSNHERSDTNLMSNIPDVDTYHPPMRRFFSILSIVTVVRLFSRLF